MSCCPLCQSSGLFFHKDIRREYFRCSKCSLVFIGRDSLPSLKMEKSHYDLHENNPKDSDYRNFLARLTKPLLKRLEPNCSGLDFGCGPGPTLSIMMEEAGHKVSLYDPIYYPEVSPLSKSYDFITATEVFEHLHQPAKDLEILFNNLKAGGWLGIMTKRVLNKEAFAKWHYIQDPTHVCFWSETTFKWVAEKWRTSVEFPQADVVLLQKA
ncbi:MAG TPA: methyltransferase [Verrucomicrobiales bacterium]|nr:methyltransferase [Verrucomicrobiales bacterium]